MSKTDFFSLSDGMTFFLEYLLPFLLVLTILVVVHELGHYLVARFNRVRVEVFSIGFGTELFGWTDRLGTRWKFSLIPLGGYVRMFGDADASSRPDQEMLRKLSDEERAQSLHYKTVWQRMAISVAGPLANFLFALVVLTALFALKGQPIYPAKVGELVPDSLAAQAGLQVKDEILKVNQQAIHDFIELREAIRTEGQELNLQVRRGSETLQILVQREANQSLGIKPAPPEFQQVSPITALTDSCLFIVRLCVAMIKGIGQLIIGKGSTDELGGILAIGSMAGESAKSGIGSLIVFMALLSVNLGMLNLFPIPVLDGGHLLFYFIEAVRGRPVSEKAQEYAFFVGFVIVLGLMVFTTWNDLVRLKLFNWLFTKG